MILDRLRRLLGPVVGFVLAAAAAFGLALVVAGPTLAEEVTPVATEAPPAGVVFDGTLTVTFLKDSTDEPIADASVELTPKRAGEALAGYSERTDETGSATFTGLPRAEDGAEAVEWQLTASHVTGTYPDNCIQSSSWSGSENVPAAAAPVALTMHGLPASSIACGPDITGIALDADGQPFKVDRARLAAVSEDGHEWETPFDVAADGTFTVAAPPVETAHVSILGAITRTAVVDGCTYSYAWVIDEDVDLTGADGEVAVELTAGEEPVLGSCTATPAPSDDAPAPTDDGVAATPPLTGNQPGDEPAITPPATDAGAGTTVAGRPLPLVLVAIVLAALLAALTAPRLTRRPTRR